jgi:hypothetical protein
VPGNYIVQLLVLQRSDTAAALLTAATHKPQGITVKQLPNMENIMCNKAFQTGWWC